MSNTEPFDTGDDLEQRIDDAVEEAGWEAFWDETLRAEAAEHGQAPTETIHGVTVRVPQDLPLRYEQKAKRLKDSNDDAAFADLLAELFGADVLDAWRADGMGSRELRVLLAWAMSHGRGKPISFREAYDLVMKADDEDEDDDGDAEGKASTSTRGGSANGGRSSKPTSRGSTSTRRKR